MNPAPPPWKKILTAIDVKHFDWAKLSPQMHTDSYQKRIMLVAMLLLLLYRQRVYDIFRGVSFAEPPVDDLRWQKPQPLQPWEGVLEADEFRPHCVHLLALSYSTRS